MEATECDVELGRLLLTDNNLWPTFCQRVVKIGRCILQMVRRGKEECQVGRLNYKRKRFLRVYVPCDLGYQRAQQNMSICIK